MTLRYRLVIWDFDGTLADTLRLALAVYNRLAEKHGFRPVTDPMSVREMNLSEFLTQYSVPAWRVPLAFASFLAEVKSSSAKIRLNQHVAEAVRVTAELGVQHAVVSSNDTNVIERCLSANDLREQFTYVRGTSRIFGKERRIRDACRCCQTEFGDALYVGDEVRDVAAARAAGVHIASATWGLNSEVALRAEAPDFILDNPLQLAEVLRASEC